MLAIGLIQFCTFSTKELHNGLINVPHHVCVLEKGDIQPSTPPGTSCGDSKLVAGLLKELANFLRKIVRSIRKDVIIERAKAKVAIHRYLHRYFKAIGILRP